MLLQGGEWRQKTEGKESKTADTRPRQRSQAEAERGKYDCREESGGRRVKAKEVGREHKTKARSEARAERGW